MLTKTSFTIRLHANDDVVIARQQLVSGTTLIDEKVAVSGLDPAGPQDRDARHCRRRAGEALQPDHRLRQAPHRRGRARAPAQPGDGRVQPRLRVRRRRQADAVRRRAGHLPGHRARGGPNGPRGHAQLHRHPVDGELLGDRRARHRRRIQGRGAGELSQRRRRGRADARQRLRHGRARARACRCSGARSAATPGTPTSPAC